MPMVERHLDLDQPPDAVWRLVGFFGAIDQWHPAVDACTVEERDDGATRTLQLSPGGEVRERLVELAEGERRQRWEMVAGVLPVSEYTATLTVRPRDAGSRVSWTLAWELLDGAADDTAVAVVESYVDAGLLGLRNRMAGG